MITLNFDASLIRAAMSCQGKKDRRHYLNGIFIGTHGDVAGTNGAVLFRGTHAWEECDTLPHDIIVSIDGRIPPAADSVRIELPDAEPGTTGTVRTDNGKLFQCKLIDGRFPDYKRAIPSRLDSMDDYTNVLCFDVDVLATMAATFGKRAHVVIYHTDHKSAIRVEWPKRPDWVFVAMPVRLDPEDVISLEPAERRPSAAALHGRA